MATEVKLPQLGQTMEEGTIVDCRVKIGDEVKKGDVIFEIETDKATLEMESPAGGVVKQIVAELDQTLLVGDVLLILEGGDEQVPQSPVDSPKAAAPPTQAPAAAVSEPQAKQIQVPKPTGKVMASPRAKKLAKDLGVDLTAVTGTGSAGKITEEDVKKAAAKPSVSAVSLEESRLGQTIPLTKKQKLTAERMVKSKREIPCFYLTVKADVTDLLELRAKLNSDSDVKIAYNDFLIKAVATGLEKFPIMTGQPEGDAMKLAENINVGLAVSTPTGLIVPVVKDADKKDVKQIAADTGALIEKAKKEKLLLTDLEGACITVSNLGAFGVTSFVPIVIPGQCSILGVGRISDTCMPDNGEVTVRKLMNLTLSIDHRVANGTYAGQFLDFVRKQLEDTSTFV
jgi:pyruvate dehydrogenase E2 component (dihydrolipoamide acetyltransferase)